MHGRKQALGTAASIVEGIVNHVLLSAALQALQACVLAAANTSAAAAASVIKAKNEGNK